MEKKKQNKTTQQLEMGVSDRSPHNQLLGAKTLSMI